jgi:ubiquinone/menaquinone biosynthesis C-methylase UbiE
MNILSGLYYFFQRKIEPGFKINKSALVVDIGSGDKPFWRADVFVDYLELGNVQRTTHTQTIHNIGMFINAKVEELPFKDNAFDFSFCSHLLEHVPDPEKAIKEITRISKAGYIEVPNGILETIHPFDSHLWFIFQNGQKLIFYRKSKKQHEVLQSNSKDFAAMINKVSQPFIRLYWNKKVSLEVINVLKEKEKFYADNSKHNISKQKAFNTYLLLVKILRIIFYRNKTVPSTMFKNKTT